MSVQSAAARWRRHAIEEGTTAGDDWVTVDPAQIVAALTEIRDAGYRGYGFVTCVDHLASHVEPAPRQRFELIYQVRNLETGHDLRVRAFVPEAAPRIASVHHLYPAANWDERETWDLFGIEFEGHPELTRILLPDDWEGHPLRRDYPVGGEAVDFTSDHEAWQTAPDEA